MQPPTPAKPIEEVLVAHLREADDFAAALTDLALMYQQSIDDGSLPDDDLYAIGDAIRSDGERRGLSRGEANKQWKRAVEAVRVARYNTADPPAVLQPKPKACASAASEPNATLAADVWDAPAYFNEYNLPAFPVGALPGWLTAFVTSLASETQTPVDLAAMLSLSVCAAAVAGNVRIQARQGWQEPLNLYTATALPSGNRKSAVFAECLKPLEEVEAALIETKRDNIAEAASEYRILEQRRDKAEREAAKADNANDRMKLEREAIDLAQKLAAKTIPAMPKLLADDATPETIATMLYEQKGRLAVLSPEGDLFDIMAGRYSSGAPNFAVLLKGHAGDDLRVDRRNRAEFVKKPALTIGLAVQPDVIRGLVDKPSFRGRGLIGRFLFSLPASRLGTRKARANPMQESVRREYCQRIKTLAAIESALDSEGKPTERILQLTVDADDCLCAFQEAIEPKLAEAGDLAMMTDWAGKLPGAILRIAGILSLAESEKSTSVSADIIRRAIQIGEYLIPHAKAAYAEMGADEQIGQAKYVLRWIEKAAARTFTKRDAHQANKGRFKKVSDLEPALNLLEEHNFIRPQKGSDDGKRGRKPSQVYEVNPSLNDPSQNSHNSQNSSQQAISENCENSENGTMENEFRIIAFPVQVQPRREVFEV